MNRTPDLAIKRSLIVTTIFAAMLLSGCSSSLSQTSCERTIEDYHNSPDTSTWRHPSQADIGLAQVEARRRWPEFVRAYSQWIPDPKESGKNKEPQKKEECFEVKIPITILFASEHIWMRVTALNKDFVTGKLDATPLYMRMYNEGTSFTVPIDKIEDWAYGSDENPTGAFTTMVLRKSKLQEINNIILQGDKPTEASVQACNAEWQRIDKKWQGMHPRTDKDFTDADKKEILRWSESTMLIGDASSAQKNTYPTKNSPNDLALACGLPLSTMQLIATAGKHFPKQIEDSNSK